MIAPSPLIGANLLGRVALRIKQDSRAYIAQRVRGKSNYSFEALNSKVDSESPKAITGSAGERRGPVRKRPLAKCHIVFLIFFFTLLVFNMSSILLAW